MAREMNTEQNRQKTLKQKIGCVGTGLITGQRTAMTLHPASAGHGITLRRSDIRGAPLHRIEYRKLSVDHGDLNLSGEGPASGLMLNGLLIALAHCDIDNIAIELSGPEIPFMDGSGQPFAFLIECAGIETSRDKRHYRPIEEKTQLEKGIDTIAVEPAEHPELVIGGQRIDFETGFDPSLVRARRPLEEAELASVQSGALHLPGHIPFMLPPLDRRSQRDFDEIDLYRQTLFASCFALLFRSMSARIVATSANIDLLLATARSLNQPDTSPA